MRGLLLALRLALRPANLGGEPKRVLDPLIIERGAEDVGGLGAVVEQLLNDGGARVGLGGLAEGVEEGRLHVRRLAVLEEAWVRGRVRVRGRGRVRVSVGVTVRVGVGAGNRVRLWVMGWG